MSYSLCVCVCVYRFLLIARLAISERWQLRLLLLATKTKIAAVAWFMAHNLRAHAQIAAQPFFGAGHFFVAMLPCCSFLLTNEAGRLKSVSLAFLLQLELPTRSNRQEDATAALWQLSWIYWTPATVRLIYNFIELLPSLAGRLAGGWQAGWQTATATTTGAPNWLTIKINQYTAPKQKCVKTCNKQIAIATLSLQICCVFHTWFTF